MGFRKIRTADAAVGLGGGVVALAGVGAIFLLLFPFLHISEGKQVHQLKATPLWWRLISLVRAAAGEEIYFRGYAITRIRELSGSLSLAALFSWVVFTVEHVEVWGWGHLLIAGFGGAILTGLFVLRNNIWVSIFAHSIVDGAAVLS
jgi:membrane protease YdiL (CAAX protease family)